jgi:hypothetical protein
MSEGPKNERAETVRKLLKEKSCQESAIEFLMFAGFRRITPHFNQYFALLRELRQP